MRDLASLEDFLAEDEPILARAAAADFSARVGLIALLAVGTGTPWEYRGIVFWRSLMLSLGVGIAAGLLIAGLIALVHGRRERRRERRQMQRVLAADPRLVPPPPSDATHRLACSALLSKNRRLPGMLYVCAHELVFQPHYFRRPWWRRGPPEPPEAIHVGPPGAIVLRLAEVRLPGLVRIVGTSPMMPVMLCEWEDNAMALRVPLTDTVMERLQRELDRLRG